MRKTIVFSALILAMSLSTAQGAVVYTFNEYVNGVVPDAPNTIDVLVNVTGEPTWDWVLSEVEVQMTSGEIFVDPLLETGYSIGWPPFTVPPVAPPDRYLPYPPWHETAPGNQTLKYTSHVGGPPMDVDYAAKPSVASYDVDETRPITVFKLDVFDTTQIPANAVEFRLLRLTHSEGATGTIRLKTNYDTSLGPPGGDVIGEWVTYDIGVAGDETPPIPDADGPYLEDDWQGDPGYNNPDRYIVLDGSGTVATDGDPILNYTWEIINEYDPAYPTTILDAGTDETFTLTIGMLAADGDLPPDHHIAALHLFTMVLTATDKDGSATSEPTTLFVPEPGSLVLLGLGGLAGLIRRRRR